jgi:tetratricopeptide (TPR) repeat protein
MKGKQTLLCSLMAVIVCSFGLVSSSAIAQQKMDQAAVEQWREDLRMVADYLPKRHPNLFAAMSREQFEQAVKRLDERVPSLSPQQIFVEMLRIVAQVKDGHTRITKRDDRGFAFRRYPLRLFLYRDGLFVQEAAPEYARAVGGRVIKIFKLNVAEHPQSAEALFLLGDGYERSGDLKQAIENYEKSLALKPKDWELADRIKALREKQSRNGQ